MTIKFAMTEKQKEVYRRSLQGVAASDYDIAICSCMRNACKLALTTVDGSARMRVEAPEIRETLVNVYTELALHNTAAPLFEESKAAFEKELS